MIFATKPTIVGHRGFGAGERAGYRENALDPPHRRTGALVAEALGRYAGQRRLFVSSFDPSLLIYLKERKDTPPGVPLGLITWLSFPVWHAIPAAANLGLDAVCLHTGTLGLRPDDQRPLELPIEQVIGLAHQAGLEVLAWSPTPEMAVRLAPAGADALTVDDIPGVLAALAGEAPARA
jgi:glycerophosphoryl diester phosphodiesterase